MTTFFALSLLCVMTTAVDGTLSEWKRSDDPPPLEAVVNQLVSRVNVLEAENGALKQHVAQLQTKRCATGKQLFQPYTQPTGSDNHRRHTIHIAFSPPFASVPVVMTAFSELDADHTDNLRIVTSTSNIQTTGFDLTAEEWDGSHNYNVVLEWIACSN